MNIFHIILLLFVSMIGTWLIYRPVHRIAVMKNIVDCPDARKLQKEPVPVLGGLSVFIGIIVAFVVCQIFFGTSGLFSLMGLMTIMLCVGTADDILSLSPTVRFVIEVAIMLVYIFASGASINDFHGLWGIETLAPCVAVPLTVVAGVGIINAINMIDGVDGLMSGYGIVIMCVFGSFFYGVGDMNMALTAFITSGALLPFFLHNVFGRKSKMFLGDGGSLMIGTMFAVFVVTILRAGSPSSHNVPAGFGLVPFTLAVLSVPVFDCLRVMAVRIRDKRSPFSPDKTHLHHMFVALGFSHLGTTLCIIVLDLLVIFAWWVSYRLSASIGLQLLVVIFFGLLNTFGLYKAVYHLKIRKSRFYDYLSGIGRSTCMENKPVWQRFRKMLDHKY